MARPFLAQLIRRALTARSHLSFPTAELHTNQQRQRFWNLLYLSSTARAKEFETKNYKRKKFAPLNDDDTLRANISILNEGIFKPSLKELLLEKSDWKEQIICKAPPLNSLPPELSWLNSSQCPEDSKFDSRCLTEGPEGPCNRADCSFCLAKASNEKLNSLSYERTIMSTHSSICQFSRSCRNFSRHRKGRLFVDTLGGNQLLSAVSRIQSAEFHRSTFNSKKLTSKNRKKEKKAKLLPGKTVFNPNKAAKKFNSSDDWKVQVLPDIEKSSEPTIELESSPVYAEYSSKKSEARSTLIRKNAPLDLKAVKSFAVPSVRAMRSGQIANTDEKLDKNDPKNREEILRKELEEIARCTNEAELKNKRKKESASKKQDSKKKEK